MSNRTNLLNQVLTTVIGYCGLRTVNRSTLFSLSASPLLQEKPHNYTSIAYTLLLRLSELFDINFGLKISLEQQYNNYRSNLLLSLGLVVWRVAKVTATTLHWRTLKIYNTNHENKKNPRQNKLLLKAPMPLIPSEMGNRFTQWSRKMSNTHWSLESW